MIPLPFGCEAQCRSEAPWRTEGCELGARPGERGKERLAGLGRGDRGAGLAMRCRPGGRAGNGARSIEITAAAGGGAAGWRWKSPPGGRPPRPRRPCGSYISSRSVYDLELGLRLGEGVLASLDMARDALGLHHPGLGQWQCLPLAGAFSSARPQMWPFGREDLCLARCNPSPRPLKGPVRLTRYGDCHRRGLPAGSCGLLPKLGSFAAISLSARLGHSQPAVSRLLESPKGDTECNRQCE